MVLLHRAARHGTLACALALAACKPAEPPVANTITVVGADYAFTAPDTVPAGLTRIVYVNTGPNLHHAQLVRLTDGRTFDSLAAFLHGPPGPFPAWAQMAGGPNTGATGDTVVVTQALEPGHYVLTCFIPDTAGVPHVAHGMLRPLEVVAAPAGAAAAEPTADVTVTLTDYAFTESAPFTAGAHTIRVVNNGPQPHEFFIARLDSTTTAAQVVAWVATSMKGPPPAVRPIAGTAALGPGQHLFLQATLPPGRYGLFCFVPDAADGREHTQHGMVKEFVVS